jgi:hypothetical protein
MKAEGFTPAAVVDAGEASDMSTKITVLETVRRRMLAKVLSESRTTALLASSR